MEKLTPSTACTYPTTLRKNPRWMGKYFFRFLTSRIIGGFVVSIALFTGTPP
jgi:hypothetical protein